MPVIGQRAGERIRVVHAAVPSAVSEARREVVAFTRSLGGGPALVRVVGLAVTEACANVAVHAYRDRPVPGDMVVEAVAGQDQMHVTVVDHGSGLAPRFDSPGIGLGLPLMSQLADRFEVQTIEGGGTKVRMRFSLPAALSLAS